MAGFPDVIAFCKDTTILVECKSATGELRPAQEKFYDRLSSHLRPHIRYTVARAEEFEDFVSWLVTVYLNDGLEWTDEMDTWRPKHDHLI
jgi:hypothetical protein